MQKSQLSLMEGLNWKVCTRCFNKRETSITHKAAVDVVEMIPTICDVGKFLSAAHALEKKSNQQYSLWLLKTQSSWTEAIAIR